MAAKATQAAKAMAGKAVKTAQAAQAARRPGRRRRPERGASARRLRRDRRRRRAQRPGRRGVPGPFGRAHAGARGAAEDRRRRDHRSSLAGRPGVQGHPAVLRDEADAPDDHQRSPAGAARLQDLPDGPVLPGLPRGRLDQALRRRRQAQLRRGLQVVEEGRRRHAALGRLAGRPGRRARPAAAHRAAEPRLAQAPRPQRDPPAGLAPPRPGRPHDRRRDPADDDVDRRPARRLVRVAAGQGRARGQRRDRDLGRPVRARHRLRDGAPLHRRRRRRPPGQLGLPGGRHGRGRRRHRPAAREAGAEIRTSARVSQVLVENGRPRGVVLENGEQLTAKVVVTTPAPAHRVPRPRGPGEPARRLRDRHRALEDPQRRRQDQPGAGRTPRLHRRPRHEPAGAPHRFGRDGAHHGVHRAGLPGRPRGQARRCGRSATASSRPRSTRRWSRRVPHHVAVHPVGAVGLERGAAHRGTPGLRRPDDRLLQRGRAELQELDHPPRHRGPVPDGAGVRPDRRQHLPRRAVPGAAVPHAARARLRRLPHPGAGPVLRQLGHPRRRRRLRHPRHAGGPGRDRRPPRPPVRRK